MLTVRKPGDSIGGMVDLTTIDQAADVVRESLDEMVKGLRETIKDLSDRLDAVVEERDDLQKEVAELREAESAELAERDEVLQRVKYWLHDILILGKPVSPCPRTILRELESVL